MVESLVCLFCNLSSTCETYCSDIFDDCDDFDDSVSKLLHLCLCPTMQHILYFFQIFSIGQISLGI